MMDRVMYADDSYTRTALAAAATTYDWDGTAPVPGDANYYKTAANYAPFGGTQLSDWHEKMFFEHRDYVVATPEPPEGGLSIARLLYIVNED
jgi:hypothetical protein